MTIQQNVPMAGATGRREAIDSDAGVALVASGTAMIPAIAAWPRDPRYIATPEGLINRNHPIGESRHNTRITDDDVRGIRAASGSQSSIAKRFGVSREHIRDIRSGKERRHVAD